jgi:hypothetical protein
LTKTEAHMNLARWIGAGVLAGVALAGGISKTFVPKQRLAAVHGGGWTAGVSAGFVKTLGPVADAWAIARALRQARRDDPHS